jgi:outer membrane protein TolC
LNDAYADVARQIAAIHSLERQLPIRREALQAAERAYDLARERYRLGLVSQLTLLVGDRRTGTTPVAGGAGSPAP